MTHDAGMSRFQMAHLVGEMTLIAGVCSYFHMKTKNLEAKVESLTEELEQQHRTLLNLETIVMRNRNARGRREPIGRYPITQPRHNVTNWNSAQQPKEPEKLEVHVSEDSSDESEVEGQNNSAQNLLAMVAPAIQALSSSSPVQQTATPEIQDTPSDTELLVSDSDIRAGLDELAPGQDSTDTK